jgi:hypothetical protein
MKQEYIDKYIDILKKDTITKEDTDFILSTVRLSAEYDSTFIKLAEEHNRDDIVVLICSDF